jgi:hypothetical protein
MLKQTEKQAFSYIDRESPLGKKGVNAIRSKPVAARQGGKPFLNTLLVKFNLPYPCL